MSEGNGKLSGLRGKPAAFTLLDGTVVHLRPITFDERNELLTWLEANKETLGKGMELERRLVALSLCDAEGSRLCSVDEVGQLDPDKVDEIAMEAGHRCGLSKRDREKKATPPDSSTTPTSGFLSTSPAPAG